MFGTAGETLWNVGAFRKLMLNADASGQADVLVPLAERGLTALRDPGEAALVSLSAGELAWRKFNDVDTARRFFLQAYEAAPDHPVVVAFQSQGMSTGPGGRPVEWLGPDLEATFTKAKEQGKTRVVMAPIGFLADHVEILYDLDIEAKASLEARGLAYSRTASLNSGDGLVDAVEAVARKHLP